MKKRTIFLIGCGLLPVLAFSACVAIGRHSRNEKELAAQDEARRTEIAQGKATVWVQEKYGFAPRVLDVNLERDGALFDSYYTGTATVWLSDGDRNFRVLVSDDEAHTGDDYQQQEFTDALLAEVNSILPGGETLYLWFSNRGNDGRFLREKFTGDNLESLLSELVQMHLMIGYVDTDFTDAPDFPLLQKYDIFTELFSFDNEAHRAQALATDIYFDGKKWAPMITGGCYIRSTEENEPFRYDVIDCGDFMLMYRDNEPDLTPPSVTAEDADALIARFRKKYPRTDLTEGTAHGWKVCTSGGAFYLYYPIHGELPSMHRIDAVVEEESTEEKLYYKHADMYAHGDYYTLECSAYPIHRIAVIDGAEN